jgi:hypothetical protein
MYELSKNEFPYLIFVPKGEDKKSVLESIEDGDKTLIIYGFACKHLSIS